jgi:hypothetical protein
MDSCLPTCFQNDCLYIRLFAIAPGWPTIWELVICGLLLLTGITDRAA